MSLHTRKEFAVLCGVSQSYLNNYIGRGKITLTDNKVDDTLPDNREFYEARLGNVPKTKAAEVVPVELDPEQRDEVKQLSLKQKKANLRKTVAEADKKELEAAKLRGESIPIDLTKNIISQMGQSFIMSFRDLAENMIIDVSHTAKLNSKEVARLRTELVDGINSSMDLAVDMAKKDLRKLAGELAVKTPKK